MSESTKMTAAGRAANNKVVANGHCTGGGDGQCLQQQLPSESSTGRLLEARVGLLWAKLKSVKWKNDRPQANEAYQPTYPEHLANIFTHGLYLIFVIYYCYHDLWVHRNHPNPDKAWACVVYALVTVGLFLVSTLFHVIFCVSSCQTQHQGSSCGHSLWSIGLLKDIFHRMDRAMIYIFIAGSYIPWLTLKQFKVAGGEGSNCNQGWAAYLRWAMWPFASLGIMYQQLFHEKFKLLETAFYLMIGLVPSLVVWEMISGV